MRLKNFALLETKLRNAKFFRPKFVFLRWVVKQGNVS